MPEPVSKSAFAALMGVSPGRVSQWIAEGKIPADALVGEGQRAKVDADKARASLQRHLDPSQRFGLNGLGTEVSGEVAPQAPAPPILPATDTVEEQIKREKLAQAQLETVRRQREERAAAGIYARADDTRQEMGRLAASLMAEFEGALQPMADAVSADFNIPRRDVVLALKRGFLGWRAGAHERMALAAASLPATIEDGETEEAPSAP